MSASARKPQLALAEPRALSPLPCDEDAEREVLSYMLTSATAAQDVLDRLTGDEFRHDADQAVVRIVRGMVKSGEAIDFGAIAERIEADRTASEAVRGAQSGGACIYLSELSVGHYCADTDIPAKCERIVQKAVLRRLVVDSECIAQAAREPSADLGELAKQASEASERVAAGGGTGADELVRAAMSGPEFMAADFPVPVSLLGNHLLCEGDGAILHAPAGMGKTFLGEQIAHAVASGELWLGMFATPQDGVPVVLIQAELSAHWLQKRRRASGTYRGSPGKLSTLTYQQLRRQLDILDPRDMIKVVRLVWQTGARLLVIDPLSQFHSEAESPEGFARVRRAIQEIILRTGCAVLLIHHEAKTSADSKGKAQADKVRGAGILVRDWAALQMSLDKDPAGHHKLHFAKVRHTGAPADLYLKRDAGGWWEPADPPVLVGNKTDEAIERALQTAGDATLSIEDLVAASARNGGAKTRRAINDALDRAARKWGLESRQALNAGTPSRPRYAYKGGSVEAGGSQAGFQIAADCGTKDCDLGDF